MSDFDRINPVIRHYERLAREVHGEDFVKVATLNFTDMQKNTFRHPIIPIIYPIFASFVTYLNILLRMDITFTLHLRGFVLRLSRQFFRGIRPALLVSEVALAPKLWVSVGICARSNRKIWEIRSRLQFSIKSQVGRSHVSKCSPAFARTSI